VLCARCTRFSEQIAGDPFIDLLERGALQQVGIYEDTPFDSYFSGNTVQICPVGRADQRRLPLPGPSVRPGVHAHRVRALRVGCALRTDHRTSRCSAAWPATSPRSTRSGTATRAASPSLRPPGDDRITRPLVRDERRPAPASWPEAIDAAVAGLQGRRARVGVLTGGRLTVENAYGYAKFARAVLGTNNIDFRSRPALRRGGPVPGRAVAGKRLGEASPSPTWRPPSRSSASASSPRTRARSSSCASARPSARTASRSSRWPRTLSNGRQAVRHLIATVPGAEAEASSAWTPTPARSSWWGSAPRVCPAAQRAAALADRTGARLAWIPRRAGDRGAIEAGCLPGLLPGGRPVADAAARVDVAAAWGVDSLPRTPGLDAEPAVLYAAADGDLARRSSWPASSRPTSPTPAAREGIEQAGFVVSLESRQSRGHRARRRRVPGRPARGAGGTFLNWEHREGTRQPRQQATPSPMTDLRALAALADALGSDLGFRTAKQAQGTSSTSSAPGTAIAGGPERGSRRRPAGGRRAWSWPRGACCSTARPPTTAPRAAGDRQARWSRGSQPGHGRPVLGLGEGDPSRSPRAAGR
jgi:NADH-quinone oxidoreductase subunit G